MNDPVIRHYYLDRSQTLDQCSSMQPYVTLTIDFKPDMRNNLITSLKPVADLLIKPWPRCSDMCMDRTVCVSTSSALVSVDCISLSAGYIVAVW